MMEMKIAYIAHPIGGDVQRNIEKILAIVKHVNLTEYDTVPFAPYLIDCLALDDSIPEHRERGIKNGKAILASGIVTEVRLYGDRISNGMRAEVLWAHHYGIKVTPMTEQTKSEYAELLTIYAP